MKGRVLPRHPKGLYALPGRPQLAPVSQTSCGGGSHLRFFFKCFGSVGLVGPETLHSFQLQVTRLVPSITRSRGRPRVPVVCGALARRPLVAARPWGPQPHLGAQRVGQTWEADQPITIFPWAPVSLKTVLAVNDENFEHPQE